LVIDPSLGFNTLQNGTARAPKHYDWNRSANKQKGEFDMLYYALVFFVIALIAAVFGFGGIAVAAAGIAKILFFLFLVVFLVTLVMGMARRA